jgi:transcriptional regulator with XRE-family HTH domain
MKGSDKMALAENIKERRIAKRISQEELSGLVGVTRRAICFYEQGDRIPDLYTAVRLADALDTTVDSLVKGKAENFLSEKSNN